MAWSVWFAQILFYGGLGALLFAGVLALPASTVGRWSVLWPGAWVGLELTGRYWEGLIHWVQLGQAQAVSGPLVGVLPLGGVAMATLLMWSVGGLMACAVCSKSSVALAGWITLLTVAHLAQWLPPWTREASPLAVALHQPGKAAQAAAHDFDQSEWRRRLSGYLRVAEQTPAPVILTPQLSIAKTWAAMPASYLRQLSETLDRRGADMVFGLYLDAPAGGLHNAAVSLGASGVQSYRKVNPFPYGERLPVQGSWRDALVTWFGWRMEDTSPGPAGQDSWWLGGVRMVLTICYDLALPESWRERSHEAQVIVNLSCPATARCSRPPSAARPCRCCAPEPWSSRSPSFEPRMSVAATRSLRTVLSWKPFPLIYPRRASSRSGPEKASRPMPGLATALFGSSCSWGLPLRCSRGDAPS